MMENKKPNTLTIFTLYIIIVMFHHISDKIISLAKTLHVFWQTIISFPDLV
jgi:hypothetical protein